LNWTSQPMGFLTPMGNKSKEKSIIWLQTGESITCVGNFYFDKHHPERNLHGCVVVFVSSKDRCVSSQDKRMRFEKASIPHTCYNAYLRVNVGHNWSNSNSNTPYFLVALLSIISQIVTLSWLLFAGMCISLSFSQF
jgi:hypothetical protein